MSTQQTLFSLAPAPAEKRTTLDDVEEAANNIVEMAIEMAVIAKREELADWLMECDPLDLSEEEAAALDTISAQATRMLVKWKARVAK